MYIKFADRLNDLREKMQEENPLGTIPDSGDFINPENEKLANFVFGPYEDECTFIFNTLIIDMNQNPGDFVKENDITSAKQFADILMPIIKDMGYKDKK